MSTTPNFSDIFIDYIEQFIDPTTVQYHQKNGYKPLGMVSGSSFDNSRQTPNLIFSPQSLGLPVSTAALTAFPLAINTTSEINQNILSSVSDDVALDKKDIYDVISTLTIEDLSLFSPKIEIFRKLPSYLVVNTEKAIENQDYIYKKIDFIDGWKSLRTSSGLQAIGEIAGNINRPVDILEGTTGVGLASIIEASWEVNNASSGLQGGPEIYDYLNKIGAQVPKFEITFKFDSINTFFGNSQTNNSELITNFLKDPKTYLPEMNIRRIEGNTITRNYSYLMFFGDIEATNTNNQLTPDNTSEAYTFLIKVGYEPFDYSIEEIINNPEKKARINKFNTFLKNYGDYFNLIFKCQLSNYDFQFAIDNSVKLKCEFSGIVEQGGVNEIFFHRNPDFNFVTVLEDLAFKESTNGSASEKKQEIENSKKILKENQQIINEFDILQKAGCLNDISEEFKKSLQKDLDSSIKLLNSLKLEAWSYFLYDVPQHTLLGTIRNYNSEFFSTWSESVVDYDDESLQSSISIKSDWVQLTTNFLTTTPIEIVDINKEINDTTSREISAGSFNQLFGIEGSSTISFFFFGDLVDKIIQKFKNYHSSFTSTKKYDNLYVTMPNIEIFQRSVKIDLIEQKFGSPSRKKIINAAHVPITMYTFRAWVYKNIILKQRQHYHLFDLLNDLKTLLTEAINYKTQEIIEREPILNKLNGKPLVYSTFYQTSFEIPDSKNILDFIIYNNEKIPIANLLDQKVFYKMIKPSVNITDITKKAWICGYTGQVLFTSTDEIAKLFQPTVEESDSSTKKLTSAGDYLKDMQLGIIHFFIGNQMGLAKSFTFNSGPAPNTREQQIANETRTGDKVRNIRYDDVEIKIVGGNFFRPTEIIYVHPHYTFGEPFDKNLTMSNILNIGGYYGITNINSSFTQDGKYETTLKAKFLVQAQAQANDAKCASQQSALFKQKYAEYQQLTQNPEGVAAKVVLEGGTLNQGAEAAYAFSILDAAGVSKEVATQAALQTANTPDTGKY